MAIVIVSLAGAVALVLFALLFAFRRPNVHRGNGKHAVAPYLYADTSSASMTTDSACDSSAAGGCDGGGG